MNGAEIPTNATSVNISVDERDEQKKPKLFQSGLFGMFVTVTGGSSAAARGGGTAAGPERVSEAQEALPTTSHRH